MTGFTHAGAEPFLVEYFDDTFEVFARSRYRPRMPPESDPSITAAAAAVSNGAV